MHKDMTIETLGQRLLELYGDMITVASGQVYTKMIHPMIFIDRDFGEWTTSPNNVLNKGCVHPARKLEKRRQTNLAKYGVDNPFKDTKKIKKAMRDKYGEDHPSKVAEFKEKKRLNCLGKYGTESPLLAKEVRERIAATNIERYGHASPLKAERVRKKAEATTKERYGVCNAMQSAEVRSKTTQTNNSRYGGNAPACSEEIHRKMRATMRSRHGVDYAIQNPGIKRQISETCLAKFGVDNPSKAAEVRSKISEHHRATIPEEWRERAVKSASSRKLRSAQVPHWKTGEILACTGSYEVAVVNYLNAKRIDFDWQIPFRLPDEIIYIVDLYLKELDLYVEIKGYMWETGRRKWEKFHELYPSELWTKEVLKSKGILPTT